MEKEPCAWCGRPKDGQEGCCPSHCVVCEGCHASGTPCYYPDDDWQTGVLPGMWAAHRVKVSKR